MRHNQQIFSLTINLCTSLYIKGKEIVKKTISHHLSPFILYLLHWMNKTCLNFKLCIFEDNMRWTSLIKISLLKNMHDNGRGKVWWWKDNVCTAFNSSYKKVDLNLRMKWDWWDWTWHVNGWSLMGLLNLLNQRYVVSFQQDTTKLFPVLGLHVSLLCIIQDQVHVLIKANNAAFNAQIDLLIQPDLDSWTILKISENQVDRLDHHFLNFLSTSFVSHFDGFYWYNYSRKGI